MNPDMSRELIAPAKPLIASRMRTSMRFFSGMCADMPSLVLEAVECAWAQRAFVWAWDLRLVYWLLGEGCSRCRGRVDIERAVAEALSG